MSNLVNSPNCGTLFYVKKSCHIRLRLDPQLRDAVYASASRCNRNVSDFCREAIIQAITKSKEQDDLINTLRLAVLSVQQEKTISSLFLNEPSKPPARPLDPSNSPPRQ